MDLKFNSLSDRVRYALRDFTSVGSKASFNVPVLSDETLYKMNPKRYSFYMQLLDALQDPKSEVLDRILSVETKTRLARETMDDRLSDMGKNLRYLQVRYNGRNKKKVTGGADFDIKLKQFNTDADAAMKPIMNIKTEFEGVARSLLDIKLNRTITPEARTEAVAKVRSEFDKFSGINSFDKMESTANEAFKQLENIKVNIGNYEKDVIIDATAKLDTEFKGKMNEYIGLDLSDKSSLPTEAKIENVDEQVNVALSKSLIVAPAVSAVRGISGSSGTPAIPAKPTDDDKKQFNKLREELKNIQARKKDIDSKKRQLDTLKTHIDSLIATVKPNGSNMKLNAKITLSMTPSKVELAPPPPPAPVPPAPGGVAPPPPSGSSAAPPSPPAPGAVAPVAAAPAPSPPPSPFSSLDGSITGTIKMKPNNTRIVSPVVITDSDVSYEFPFKLDNDGNITATGSIPVSLLMDATLDMKNVVNKLLPLTLSFNVTKITPAEIEFTGTAAEETFELPVEIKPLAVKFSESTEKEIKLSTTINPKGGFTVSGAHDIPLKVKVSIEDATENIVTSIRKIKDELESGLEPGAISDLEPKNLSPFEEAKIADDALAAVIQKEANPNLILYDVQLEKAGGGHMNGGNGIGAGGTAALSMLNGLFEGGAFQKGETEEGSFYQQKIDEIAAVEKDENLKKNPRERNKLLDNVLDEVETHPIYNPKFEKVSMTDRVVFIAVTFIIRSLGLFLIDWGLNSHMINSFNRAFLLYIIIYMCIFLVWVLLVNAGEDGKNMFFRMVFYYVNWEQHGPGRVMVHLLVQLMLLPVPFVVKERIVGKNATWTYEQRRATYRVISNFTFFIWILTSIIALRY